MSSEVETSLIVRERARTITLRDSSTSLGMTKSFEPLGRLNRWRAGFALGALAHHRHEPILDRGRRLGRLEAEGKGFMQGVALPDVIFALLPEFLPRGFELRHLLTLEGPDHVKACAILEFVKAHLSAP